MSIDQTNEHTLKSNLPFGSQVGTLSQVPDVPHTAVPTRSYPVSQSIVVDPV